VNTPRVVYHLARADFLERIRRYSFLVVLGVVLTACYYVHTDNIDIHVGGYRGTMNSAWMGAVMTLIVTTLLGMSGFYLVNNCVSRDEQTGVGQILAATPVSKLQYVCGKALSNFAVLSLIVFVLMLAAVPLQWLAGEDRTIRLVPLLSPFVLFALPLVAIISAFAILIETVSWLRGAVGNVLYFILFVTLLPLGFTGVTPDFTGIRFLQPSMEQAAQHLPHYHQGDFGFNIGPDHRPRGFEWNGVAWNATALTGQAFWLGLACGLCLISTLTFNRFDRSPSALRRALAKRAPPDPETATAPAPLARAPRSLPPVKLGFSFLSVFVAELKLLLKGMPWWWHIGALGGIVAGFALPADSYRQALWFAWIWPVGVWSQMGNREMRFQTGELVFSAPRPLWRQLPATWLAGVTVGILAASGVLIRMAAVGDWTGVEKGFAGAVFIASLALAFGASSGTSKLFEGCFTGLWYLGVLNRVPVFDYTQISAPGNYTAGWLVASGCALLLAFTGRLARLRR